MKTNKGEQLSMFKNEQSSLHDTRESVELNATAALRLIQDYILNTDFIRDLDITLIPATAVPVSTTLGQDTYNTPIECGRSVKNCTTLDTHEIIPHTFAEPLSLDIIQAVLKSIRSAIKLYVPALTVSETYIREGLTMLMKTSPLTVSDHLHIAMRELEWLAAPGNKVVFDNDKLFCITRLFVKADKRFVVELLDILEIYFRDNVSYKL